MALKRIQGHGLINGEISYQYANLSKNFSSGHKARTFILQKVMYRVDLKTNKCNKTVPHRDFHPFGPHENSTFVAEFIIGSLERFDTGVLVNQWMHTFDNGTGRVSFGTTSQAISIILYRHFRVYKDSVERP